jgi:GAF domain-containing protein
VVSPARSNVRISLLSQHRAISDTVLTGFSEAGCWPPCRGDQAQPPDQTAYGMDDDRTGPAGDAEPTDPHRPASTPQIAAAILDQLPVAIFVLAGDGSPAYANAAARDLLGEGPDPSTGPQDLARRYRAVLAGTGTEYPSDRMPIVRALAGETTTVDDMEIERADGAVPVEVWAAPIFAPDAGVAYAVAAFHDVSERRRAEADAARLYAETVLQSRWLDAVRDIQFAILAGAGLDAALALVASQARELLESDSTCIGIPDGEGFLVIRAADGVEAATLRGERISTAGSIMGEVIAMGAAAVLDDATCHGALADPVVQVDLGPAVFVPLSAEGQAFGSLCVARQRGGTLFGKDEVAAAEAFANQAALAVQIGRAQRQLAHLAVARDRERQARELQKHTVESLAGVQDRLSHVRLGVGDIVGQAEAIDRAVEDLGTLIAELRLQAGGAPSPSGSGGLGKDLEALAEEFEERTGIVTVVRAEIDGAGDDLGQAEDILRLVRRALSGIGDQARTCQIDLVRGTEGTAVRIDDDGPDPGGGRLRERRDALAALATEVGGRVDVDLLAGDEHGTTVRFVLPPALRG